MFSLYELLMSLRSCDKEKYKEEILGAYHLQEKTEREETGNGRSDELKVQYFLMFCFKINKTKIICKKKKIKQKIKRNYLQEEFPRNF